MTTERRAIPTRHAGVQFRSRLEARWAHFFDLVGWHWEYEPIDLKGYIPDFILMLPLRPVLVEVKPALSFAELWQATNKVEASGWEQEALVVGASLKYEDSEYGRDADFSYPKFGLLTEKHWIIQDKIDETEDGSWWWQEAEMHFCTKCDRQSFHHTSGSFACRVNGCYEGDHYLGSCFGVEQQWREAGNAVQWFSKSA